MKEYTKILSAEPSNPVIDILADLLSGKGGELNAIHQYFFQYVMTSDIELKKLFKHLMMEEMKHAELLADSILAFGGIPYLCNHFNKFFSTDFLDYSLSEKEFVLNDIKDEEFAIKSYNNAIEQVDNESLKKLLGEIRDDELSHLDELKKQLERFEN